MQTSPTLSSKHKILPKLTIIFVGLHLFLLVASPLKIFIWSNLFVEVEVAAPYIGKNHAWCLRKTLNRAFEITNYKHKNTGAGSISEGPSQPFRPSKYKQDNVVQGLYSDNLLFWLHPNSEYGLKTLIRDHL